MVPQEVLVVPHKQAKGYLHEHEQTKGASCIIDVITSLCPTFRNQHALNFEEHISYFFDQLT